jgi:hypothetical protein
MAVEEGARWQHYAYKLAKRSKMNTDFENWAVNQ